MKGRRKVKKSKKHNKKAPPQEEEQKVSKSFIFANGKVSRSIKQLIKDFRLVMMPHTAIKLQEREKNTIKDFASVAGQLGVTHFVSFTTTERTSYMKVVRAPRGPTLTFRLHEFSLMSDLVHLLKNPHSPGIEYKSPPLVVLNNFTGEEQHIKLMAVMFQNLFPAINLATVKVIDCRRVVLFDYDKETKKIQIRHFLISVKPVGISKSVKQIVVSKEKLPSLGNYEDIAEFVAKGSGASESDIEDAEEGKVVLPEKHAGRLDLKQKQSAVRLIELGPRMTIQLVKIEEEFYSGDVVFHEFIKKTPEEVKALKEYHEQKKREKERRKKIQEENVKRKRGEDDDGEEGDNEESDMDDADYYREEVGEEPDADMFNGEKEDKPEKRAKFNPLYKRKQKKKDDDESNKKPTDNKKRKREESTSAKPKKPKSAGRNDDWVPTQIPAKRLRPVPKLKKKKKDDKVSREDRDEKKAKRFDSKQGGKGGKGGKGGFKTGGGAKGGKGKFGSKGSKGGKSSFRGKK